MTEKLWLADVKTALGKVRDEEGGVSDLPCKRTATVI